MARLRYNGLSTTLGGSLTNVATSVTFAAALTHSNGTNVPTITAGDYIPLAILGATGHLSEIVYLTAYTAAGTTGTIARGQEGTTAVVHSSGDVVTQAMLVGDGGGGDYFRTGYYSPPVPFTGTPSTVAMTVGRLHWTPMPVPVRRTFDRIGVNVTVGAGAGGVVRLGIYTDGGGTPGTLILDAGTVATTGTGAAEITISQALDPGVYWLAVASQVSACTIVWHPVGTASPFNSFATTPLANASPPWPITASGVTGALPSTAAPTTSTSPMPMVQLRAA